MLYKGEYPSVPAQFDYIIDYLFEIGLHNNFSWGEIKAWSEVTGITLEWFEIEYLKKLSAAYSDQYFKSRKKECMSPWVNENVNREEVGKKIKNAFKMISNSGRKKGRGLRKSLNQS